MIVKMFKKHKLLFPVGCILYILILIWFIALIRLSRNSLNDLLVNPIYIIKSEPSPFVLFLILLMTPIFVVNTYNKSEQGANQDEKKSNMSMIFKIE